MSDQVVQAPNYNRAETSLNLIDVLQAWKRQIFLELNCHAIATVQSIDTGNQTLTAQLNYQKTYYQEGDKGQQISFAKDYALLVDCPFVVIGGGGASLTFPITAGDECIIMFNDRDLDNWYAGASTGSVATNRLHSFSDGMALVGFPLNPVFDSLRALLANGATGVGVSSTKVKIYNATTTLNTQLQALITDLETFASACASATTVANIATAGTALNTALASLATAIGGLLE